MYIKLQLFFLLLSKISTLLLRRYFKIFKKNWNEYGRN